MIVWKPDSSMIAVGTDRGHIIFYNIVVYTEVIFNKIAKKGTRSLHIHIIPECI